MTTTHTVEQTLPAPYGSCPFDPPPAYTAAHRQAPVTTVRLPDGAECALVTGYDEVRVVLADQRFSADASNPGFPFLSAGQRRLATAQPSFIRMDDPEHGRLRRLVSKDFVVRRIEQLRPAITGVVDAAVDRMLAQGPPCDLVSEFSLPVPSLVICLMLGVPYADHGFFQAHSRTLLDNTRTEQEVAAAHRALMGYLAELAEDKRLRPGDDILSRLAARDDLTPQQVASLGFMLLVTGHESTANMTSIAVLALLRDPARAAGLRADPARIPAAVEELLRHLTIIHLGLGRVATADLAVGGVTIPAGQGVICMLSTANRQAGVFGADPDVLDLDRDARRHLAFGFGVHQCLGHALARAELQIALDTLLRRLPGLRLAADEHDLVYATEKIVYGVESLPVAW